MANLRESLGSGPPTGTIQFTIFIPSVDRDGNPIDQAAWKEEALRVLGTLFRGATAFPPGKGVWRDDERGGHLQFEEVVLVTSYVDPDSATDDGKLKELRGFLHRMGREANQGEVGIVAGSEYHGITQYDQSEEE